MSIDWSELVGDPARVAAVERTGLVGSGADDAFDRLIELAVELTGIRRGCITLVDGERNTPKSLIGFPADGGPLYVPVELTFCRLVVGSGRPLIVDDSREDPRTIGDPAIALFSAVTWAGYPIEDAQGFVLGTFCLMDDHPHVWTPRDLQILATLAKAASTEIALRGLQDEARLAHEDAQRSSAHAQRTADEVASFVDQLASRGSPYDGVAEELLMRLRSVDDASPSPRIG